MSALTAIAGTTGRASLQFLRALLSVCVLITDTISWTFIRPFRGQGLRIRATVYHFVEFGAHSLPIVGLICFLVGAIIAMQMAPELKRYGATPLVANLVGVAAIRELAALMTAILVTGRSGSAITAEIGTMKVAEEIDALEVMGVNPVKFLVVPKFVGMLLAVPCLTVLAMFIMIFGGYIVGVWLVGIDPDIYRTNTINALTAKDLAAGMSKSVVFALVISWVGIYRGFQVEGGAEGVGRMTTSSVVTSILLIIVVDLIFTALFFF